MESSHHNLIISLWAIVLAQFLGAFNDHFFKMVLSLLIIDPDSHPNSSSAYLSLSGIIYVLPFLLFSGFAGFLADRHSKRLLMISAKLAEIVLAIITLLALIWGSVESMLVLLFLFAMQSAFFSPSKYGILPELLPLSVLPRANGVIEFTRYIAIILGTALGGVLLTAWEEHRAFLGLLICVVAIVGWLASLAIPGPRRNLDVVVNPKEGKTRIRDGLKIVIDTPGLRMLIGATTIMDITMTLLSLVVLLLAKETLRLADLESGLLIALAGIGIAAGSVLAGWLSRGTPELGFVPMGSIGASLAILFLACGAASFSTATVALVLMGMAGGFIIVPLYTALQFQAPAAWRGQVIGINNFFNMLGVLLGSGMLWLLCNVFGFAPRGILFGLAIMILSLTGLVLCGSTTLRGRTISLAVFAGITLPQNLIIRLRTSGLARVNVFRSHGVGGPQQ